jgi:integrase
VFPSRGSHDRHVESHALSVAMRRMTAGGPTPHDLRRTCATRLAAAGVRGEDVAAVLNHVRGDVTGKHYDQYQRADEKAAALQRWSRLLTAILKPQPPNVITLRS